MIKYFRKNQKKALAIFSVFLMIAFALPTASQMKGCESPSATMGGVKVSEKDLERFRDEWTTLRAKIGEARLATALGSAASGERGLTGEQLSIAALGDPRLQQPLTELFTMYLQNPRYFRFMAPMRFGQQIESVAAAMESGANLLGQFNENEEMFMLLVREAEANGIGVSDETLESILATRGQGPDTDAVAYGLLRAPLHDLLLVLNSARRASSISKVSLPRREFARITSFQTVGLNLVEYNARDYLDKVPAPTDKQIADQFDKYKDQDPTTNKDGFGYKFPNRVKLDAISITESELRSAVGTIDLVDLNEYYIRNKSEFTAAVTQPSTKPSDTFSLSTDLTRQKSFAEAKEEVIKKVTTQRIAELSTKMRDAIRTTMRADYEAYKLAADAKKPIPASSVGAPYNSYDYLASLRDDIRKKFNVILGREQFDGWTTAEALAATEIGKTTAATEAGALPFSRFVTEYAGPFLSDEAKKKIPPEVRPELWQPTPIFVGDARAKTIIARVTAADPAHVPASVDEVRQAVIDDVKIAAAYEVAKLAAGKAVESANSGQWLQGVANAENRLMISTKPISLAGGSITEYEVSDRSKRAFFDGALNLLTLPQRSGAATKPAPTSRPVAKSTTQPTTQSTTKPATQTAAATKPAATQPTTVASITTQPTTAPISSAFKDHPVGMIELPLERKVVVAEIDQVKPIWTKDRQSTFDAYVVEREQQETGLGLLRLWADYDNVVKRTNFKFDDKRGKRSNSQPKNQPPVDDKPF